MLTLPVGDEVGSTGAAVGAFEGTSVGTFVLEGTLLGEFVGCVEWEGASLDSMLGEAVGTPVSRADGRSQIDVGSEDEVGLIDGTVLGSPLDVGFTLGLLEGTELIDGLADGWAVGDMEADGKPLGFREGSPEIEGG